MDNIYESLSYLERRSFSEDDILEGINQNEMVLLRGKRNNVLVGKKLGVKVNTSIGISDRRAYCSEVEKIKNRIV